MGLRAPQQQTLKNLKRVGPTDEKTQDVGKTEQPKVTDLSLAKCKIFATRKAAEPLTNPARDEAKISVILVAVLTGCECKASTNLQVFSNKTNGTIMVAASVTNCD